MVVVANICLKNVIFCSVKVVADRTFFERFLNHTVFKLMRRHCPLGYVVCISCTQNTGYIPGKKTAANKLVYMVLTKLNRDETRTKTNCQQADELNVKYKPKQYTIF